MIIWKYPLEITDIQLVEIPKEVQSQYLVMPKMAILSAQTVEK